MFGDVTVPGEVMAGMIGLLSIAGVGITSWMLLTLVKLTSVVAGLEERLDGHERRIDRLERP
jgi:hypothetical protein